MKLRNKKTGEIGYPYFQNWKDKSCTIVDVNAIQIAEYASLAELNEEWEDYEEPKGYWYYDTTCCRVEKLNDNTDKEIDSSIGNCFDTKEEAEKAVEKLKAWKRLKDKGFRFENWDNTSAGPYRPIWFYFEKGTALEDIKSDLDLLFGGEE